MAIIRLFGEKFSSVYKVVYISHLFFQCIFLKLPCTVCLICVQILVCLVVSVAFFYNHTTKKPHNYMMTKNLCLYAGQNLMLQIFVMAFLIYLLQGSKFIWLSIHSLVLKNMLRLCLVHVFLKVGECVCSLHSPPLSFHKSRVRMFVFAKSTQFKKTAKIILFYLKNLPNDRKSGGRKTPGRPQAIHRYTSLYDSFTHA